VELLDAVEMRLRKNELLRTEFRKDIEGLNDFFSKAKDVGELLNISNKREVKLFDKKQIIYSERKTPRALYFINSGKVKTFKTNPQGKEYITNFHSKGDFLGYTSLLEETNYSESAEALVETEIYVIPKEDFLSLMYSNRDVSGKFIKILTHNLKEKEERLLKLAYDSVRMRVAHALLMLSDKYLKGSNGNVTFSVSREDLANAVGTAKESLIRTLSDFKDEKLIDLKASHITILDIKGLSEI
jgi:CRP/FNR family transcriptional regulator, polysaccharide utilization system transcription regulator